uniref:VWFA domain-containing protein n=1 Tax=Chrysemys picta bellii TaxID=8478 RepID=A0A8C3FGD1_CHRPI
MWPSGQKVCPPLALMDGCLTPAVLAPSHGFSVDVEGPITFQEAAAGFGQSVVQFGSASAAGLLVGAPLQTGDVNETGKVYKCDPGSRRCEEIPIQRPSDAVKMSLGLSLAARDSQILVCGPTVHQACGENMYIKGYCFLLDQSLRQLRRIPDSLPECPKRPTDIVFLIDGSGSIGDHDFGTMKTFVIEVIRHFRGTDTLFALAQFSSSFQEHFDFNKFKSTHDIDSLVRQVRQLRQNTYTPTAIRKVVRELFVSWKGSRDAATKILIVVTDGRKNDNIQYSDVIPEAEREGIIRYAIGVGRAFSLHSAQRELHEIASDPTDEHVFRVNDFDALRGIQNQLQEKIFAIEGTGPGRSTSLALGLCKQDGPVLGAVGAYDWAGGVYLYVVGAPRHNHIGKVILFRQDSKRGGWREETEVLGEQVRGGVSVGGADPFTLCLFGWGLQGTMQKICTEILQGQTGQAFGRFGASMSEIGDISGDRQMDVAIGAPMENDNRGALYIFHGGNRGLSPQYRQVKGSQFPSGLHYFGQAVSGGTDLTWDGLPDIAVGAQGQVLLLRSRPVLKVKVSMSFQPPTIPTSAFECQGQEQLNTEASRAEVCFTITKSTMDSLGDRISSTIQYSLALDPGWTKIRAAFDSTGPVLSKDLRLGIEKKCETYQITLPLCPEDTVTPITLRLNYTLMGDPIAAANRLRPILSEDSELVSAGSVRCQSQALRCGHGTAWRKLSPFSPLSLSTLVVGVTPELNTTVSIQSRGENSYSTRVQFFYPATLSYRRVLLLQVPQRGAGSAGGAVLQGAGGGSAGGTVLQGAGLERGLGIRVPGFSSCLRICFFQVKNLRQRSVPISVTFQFPVELSGVRVWDASEVVPSKVPASPCPCVSPAHPLPHPAISFRPQDCSVATCKKIRCRIASLEMQQPLEFMIKGNVSFQWVSQVRELPLPTTPLPQVQTVVERSEVYNYLPIIVGSSVGGLVLLALITTALYKVSRAGLGLLPHSPSPWGRGLWPPNRWGRDKGLSFGGSHSPSFLLLHHEPVSIWLSPSPLCLLPVWLLQAPVQADDGGSCGG